MSGMYPIFKPVGDCALLVIFGADIDLKINQRVHTLDRLLQHQRFPGMLETVPSYISLLVYYDGLDTSYAEVRDYVQQVISMMQESQPAPARRVEIPTKYGGVSGPDLDFVAHHHQLTTQQVIQIHSSRDYPVYMMGFTPGFPYLGGMDEVIATPRLQTPRILVPAGSVGIAGKQTGVYPIDSPGGWQIIGNTSLKLFDPQRQPPFLLSPGDLVRFVPIG